MKQLRYLPIVLILTLSNRFFCQSHKGKCGLEIEKAYTQNVLGKSVGYYVEFKNNAGQDVDAIEWKAKFYNNFGEYKGEKDGQWSSGNIIKPIKPGAVTKDLETNWIDGATKVFITVKRVHLAQTGTCK
ncbi:MAG: hypothetical protein ACK5D5_07225 [Bacteroidota bacterium]|jgi:hypothetical protein